MIIAIDGYEANVGNRVGIGRYAFEILKHIYQEVKTQNLKLKTVHSFRIYLPSQPLSDMPVETSWWKYRIVPFSHLWTWIGLPLALRIDSPRPRLIFSPTHYIPRFVRLPNVMAIMDMSYGEYPELFRRKDLYQLVHWTRYAAHHTRRILTISEFSKNAIIQGYGIPKSRVVVTYPGLSMAKKSSSQASYVLERYHINTPYILSVGTIQPRKNYERLIEAFAIMVNNHPSDVQYELQLVIVGKKGWLWEEILSAPKRFGVEQRVRFLDYVPDDDLRVLYENAQTFVLASLYEGFGLPVLEAMAYRCPIVVSNISSLPEIAGNAAIYVNPQNTENIRDGIVQSIAEKDTKAGMNRVERGFKRTSLFSWEKAAKKTLRVFDQIMKANI